MGIDARADCGSSKRHVSKLFLSLSKPHDPFFDLPCVSLEFLAEAHRSGILEVCPPCLHYGHKLHCFGVKGRLQLFKGRYQVVVDRLQCGNLNRRWDHVVG